MIRLRSLLKETKCSRCHGSGHVLSKTDKARVQCPACRGTGRAINEESSQKLLKVGDRVMVIGWWKNRSMTGQGGKVVHIPAPGVQGREASVQFADGTVKNIPWDYLEKESVSERLSEALVWNVFLDGKVIDSVWSTEQDPEAMKKMLINHDGFDPRITVKLAPASTRKPRKDMDEAGGDSSGSDQMGSYRSIANDDPWASRIHLANMIRQFADEVESVKDGPQIDPQQDTYDSPNIDGFIEAVGQTQKMMNSVINYWKKEVAKLDDAQPGKSLT